MSPIFKNILVIRPDNMGDIIMSTPAIRALRQTFGCALTLLTSSMGAPITPFISDIDATIVADIPWVQTHSYMTPEGCQELVARLRSGGFDLAVILSVYSQCSLPAALLCWLAGIPNRLAYARENPYCLLTHWLPDKEPLTMIRHQVERDLHLVHHIGATTPDQHLRLSHSDQARRSALEKLRSAGIDTDRPFIILHPGVSEKRREYPVAHWQETVRILGETTSLQLVITGSPIDKPLARQLADASPAHAFNAAGLLNIEELIAAVSAAALVISVNTATAHIAAAVDTPVVVLYARTNPQHTPWRVRSHVLEFSCDPYNLSRNEIIRHVSGKLYPDDMPFPKPAIVAESARMLLHASLQEASV